MPYQKNGVRNYQAEKAWDHSHDGGKRLKDRAKRNAARAIIAKKKGVSPTAIKGDVGHKIAVSRGGKNTLSNLFVQSPATNRSFARNSNGSLKSERSKRER